MAVIRGALPTDNFTVVSNDWARDPDLSLKAKGLLLAISSHKEGYRLTIQQLIAQNKDGRDAIYAGLRELVDAGYMVLIQNRSDGGRMAEVDYRLTGKLSREDQVEQPAGEEQPRSKKRRRSSAPFTEKPDTAVEAAPSAPYADFPYTAEPDTDPPCTEDPTLRTSIPKKITTPKKTNHVTSTSARDVTSAADRGRRARTPARGPVSASAGDGSTAAGTGVEVSVEVGLDADVDVDEVERTVVQLPQQLHPTGRDAVRLRGLVEQRMRRGWTRQDILETVDRRLRPGALDNPCGLFAKTLVPLEEAPPHPHQVQLTLIKPWCGQCDERTRRVLDESGFPDFTQPTCTECEQLTFAQHMERGAS
ncbi:hypothetical protein [Kineococcus sp. SYSU DK005]|uniref:hypothetical protein n=1 Tax=Kineococcus sp. SYSU DK005 TaxID=3383126 RepID=UPI003D7E5B35